MPSNVENILNGILTGDGSGIQKPASRVEALLFAIYEQGGGGGDSVIGGIKLTIDNDYVMTATLVDKDGEEYGVSDDIDLPLEEMVVDAEYDSQTQKIKLELKNGNYVEFSVAELVSGLQTELSSNNKLNPAYIAYDASHRAVSDTEKNWWNAKQNAISDLETIRSGAAKGATAVQPATMTEALSAKQNSLSETQLVAVNSGINSTKVGQIETNKTNILYALKTGANNLSPVDNVIFTRPAGAAYTDPISINLAAGDYVIRYKLTTTVNAAVAITYNGSEHAFYDSDAPYSDTVITHNFTVTNSGTSFRFYFNQAATVSELMIVPKEVWDTVGHDFMPPAIPNYDLTRLESEDRAGLVECVDGGAKNLVDWHNTVSFQNVTIDNGTYTTSGDSLTVLRFQVAAIDSNGGQIMAFNGNGTVPTANGVINIPFTIPTGTAKIRAGHNGSTYNGRFDIPLSGTTLEVGKSYVLQVNVTQYTNSSGIFKWKDLMVCANAAFGVSQKFVAYKQPNSITVHDDTSTQSSSFTFNVNSVKVGTYLMSIDGSSAPTNRSNASLYVLTIFTSGIRYTLSAVCEIAGTKITSHSISDDVITFVLDANKFHTVHLLNIGYF